MRKATNEDLPKIKELIRSVLEEFNISNLLGAEKKIVDLEKEYFKNRGTFLVALDSQTIIGTIAIGNFEQITPKRARVERFYVDKKYRGKGVGKKLMGEVIQEAQALGYNDIICGSEHEFTRAHTAYVAAGFTEYRRDEKCIYFKKEL